MSDDKRSFEINNLSSNLEILKCKKEELMTQINGEKLELSETERELKNIDSKIMDIKLNIGIGQSNFIAEQEKNLRSEVFTLSTIPALVTGGLIITFGGLSAGVVALVSSIGSYFIVSNGVYKKKIRNVRLNSVEHYRSSEECMNLTDELDSLLKQRQILNDKIDDIKYEINSYNNELNILTSKIIYVECKKNEILSGSYEHVNTDVIDTSVVRALK